MSQPTADQLTQLTSGDDARELVAAVAAAPHAPLRVAVSAQGGYGKTTLLRELGRRFGDAGLAVLGLEEALADPARCRDAAVLVDDAHRLADARVERLCALAADDRLRLVVAYRPWPRSEALAELTDVLDGARPAVLLRPWDRDEVAARVAAALPGEPASPGDLAERVLEHTGGVPRYVDRVVRGLAVAAPDGSPAQPWRVPASALHRFQPDFDRLDRAGYRLLLGRTVAPGMDTEQLARLLGFDDDVVWDTLDGLRATGMLDRAGAVLPIVAEALSALGPAERALAVRRRLVHAQRDRGGAVLELVRPLLDTAATGQDLAWAFERAADEALTEEPALAAELYGAAITAGSPAAAVAGRQAKAAGLCGDFDTALRLADSVVADAADTDRAQAADVAATVLAHRGLLGPAAELHRWSGSPTGAAFAAVGLLGTGQPADATALLDDRTTAGPPVLAAGAVTQLAEGVRQSVACGAPSVALATLTRAATMLEPVGRAELWPDTPAALAALVALHSGEFAVADSTLERAIAASMGGALGLRRHRLLRAWGAMLRGDTTTAAAFVEEAGGAQGELEPRDALFASALRAGIARRDSDLGALRESWGRAREAAVRHPVDLFSLLPLGELAVAAARLGEPQRLSAQLADADELLERLDGPPVWEAALRWSLVHAAIASEQPEAAAPHAVTLATLAERTVGPNADEAHPYFAVLATAATSWLDVLTGHIEPAPIEEAARALDTAGLHWDAARLAGQAAIRTSDRKAMVRLLDCARSLQGKANRQAQDHGDAPPSGESLSEREREVATLVLDGLTYKEIGERLFISAKTVEYHVARMRQRLGCSSRADLLDRLRLLLGQAAG